MALNSQHPDFQRMVPDWALMSDAYAGERTIKEKGQLYLPATPSMVIDGMKSDKDRGYQAYLRYKQRAVFWDYVSDAVEALVGMMHQKPPVIKLPAVMEPLRVKASREGETLHQLLRRIHEQQLVNGRLGLLADLQAVISTDPSVVPYLALYNATAVVNWDVNHDNQGTDVTELVVLNETTYERNSDFGWDKVEKYRVLKLADGMDVGHPPRTYIAGVFKYGSVASDYSPADMAAPMYRGRTLTEIPFTFVNSKDVLASPDNPPLLGLANLCLAIYRGEADYRQSLFMQGQDTLVIIGGAPSEDGPDPVDTAQRVGAGATIQVNLGGDAKYIGVSATGLAEQRTALENDKLAASTKAGQLVSPQAGKQESGDALTTRISAQTASLMQIAITGAAGLEMALKGIARWMGANEDEVSVEANTEFLDHLMTAKDLSDLMDARTKGSPMSLKTIHDNMIARGMTELTFEEEVAQIVTEQTLKGAAPLIVPDPNKQKPGPPPTA
jgi:Domain of unknown function (DUF4055)